MDELKRKRADFLERLLALGKQAVLQHKMAAQGQGSLRCLIAFSRVV